MTLFPTNGLVHITALVCSLAINLYDVDAADTIDAADMIVLNRDTMPNNASVDSSTLYTHCAQHYNVDAKHAIPLATHFLQGSGGKITMHKELLDGLLINFTAPIDEFSPITPYVYAIFAPGGLPASINGDSNGENNGNMRHGFFRTPEFLTAMHDVYEKHSASGSPGLPDTIRPSITLYERNGDDSHNNVCTEPSTMSAMRWEGCRPAPNAVLSLNQGGHSNDDSTFVMDILQLSIDINTSGDDDTKTTTPGEGSNPLVRIHAFVPNTLQLVDEGALHEPVSATQRHYHWHMDCSKAVDSKDNTKLIKRKLLTDPKFEEAVVNDDGLFVLFMKGV